MECNSLISIILPVYNGEKYLSQSIESVLNQTYRNIELIIVNDYSTDQTLSICNQYAENDSRIKIINNNENKKLPASLNIGHKEAKGDFITWTSDDNFYEPNALDVLLNEMILQKADVVYSNFNLINENGDLVRIVELPAVENIIFGNVISCCFLYKKEVFERNIGYKENLFLVEDYDFWLRATLHSHFVQTKKVLYYYRRHEASLTNLIGIDDSKKMIWKRNVNDMFIDFWKNFEKRNYSEIAELSTKILLYQKIDFDWIISNNEKIKSIKLKLKNNLNFVSGLSLEKVFLKNTVNILVNDKNTKKKLSRSIFILKNYVKCLDKNTIKTLIKYSFFK